MRLSELTTGDRCVVVKVTGHGGFRKRIVEMGFVQGKAVEVMQSAPLQDPVKYRIMGYEISLRRSEARMIEVVSSADIADTAETPDKTTANAATNEPLLDTTEPETQRDNNATTTQQLHDEARRRHKTITVALVGNPNCGKTSLFNYASGAHERTGNYAGVTVDATEGRASYGGYELLLTDLPGTYSLSAYSPEELFVRRHLVERAPDVVVNVVDASNLERNLYLTTQLIDMNLRTVCALNMFDETEKRGDSIDCKTIGRLFGVPMLPTAFNTGRGVDELFAAVIDVYEGRNEAVAARHIHINHGADAENGIAEIQRELKKAVEKRPLLSTRFLAIKLLEGDRWAADIVTSYPNATAIKAVRDAAAARIRSNTGDDCESLIMNAKYGFVHGALQEARYAEGTTADTRQTTRTIDNIVTDKYVGIPLFVAVIWLMFEVTFSLGAYPMDWIDAAVGLIGDTAGLLLPDGPLRDMVCDGIIGGVGAVIVFLPQILILYFFISFMEDCGYMARAAFIMDKLMHKMGLHGKSFIPLIMGFGCNVPAVMATRTIESRNNRMVTMLILPLMSCSARLPIYIMIVGVMFGTKSQGTIMMALYLIGIAVAVVMSRLFARVLFKGEDTPFVMELPPYRFPTAKAILRHTWEKGKQYLKKMGGIILVASIIVWALGYFPMADEGMTAQQQQEQSYIGRMGHAVEPVFAAQGFDWKLDVGLLSGVGAKEIVASTIGILYGEDIEADDGEELSRYDRIRLQMEADGTTPLSAFCFLLFVLLYFPCIATIAAIKGETGSWRWAAFAAVYTTALAWIVSAAVYQIGSLFV